MNSTNSTALLALAIAMIGTPSAFGGDQRDVVFECPLLCRLGGRRVQAPLES